MEELTFVMMVGLAGSGKSTVANAMLDEDRSLVLVSSDEYRFRFYGDEALQGDNKELFNTIHNDILVYLRRGRSVIFDATNLTRKNRASLLNKIASSKLDVHKVAVLVATQYEICVERDEKRNRSVGEYVISKMRERFDVPMATEGFDQIEIVWNYNADDYDMTDYMQSIMFFEQDNPNHSMTLGAHCQAVADNVYELTKLTAVRFAGLLHDNGKRFTKVFHNMKGEPTKIAHYYHHENVGAYEALFFTHNEYHNDDLTRFVAGLVNYHMRPYFVKSEKSRAKLERTLPHLVHKYIYKLNEADVKAH